MGGERIDATYLAVMTEIMPSMSDTLTKNRGPYDARVLQEKAAAWAEKRPVCRVLRMLIASLK